MIDIQPRIYMERMLKHEWETLQKEFSIDSEMIICDRLDIIMSNLTRKPFKTTRKITSDEILDIITGELVSSHNGIFSQYAFKVGDDGNLRFEFSTAFIVSTHLYAMMIDNLDRVEHVIDYFKLALRHEMGHIVDFHRFEKEFVTEKKFSRFIQKSRKEEDALIQWEKDEGDNINEEEYYRKYYEMPFEKRANIIAGITTDMLYDMATRVNRLEILRKTHISV